MKTYLRTIKILQQFFLGISIIIMFVFPLVLAFMPQALSEQTILNIYDVSHVAIFFVMLIRPLADIFIKVPWIRPLVILRKGIGVFSASIVVSFMFAKLIVDPSFFAGAFLTSGYWSIQNFALLAHLADISAIILLVTSNNLSKKLLHSWWKKVQKLSYVFFYGSSLYVFLSFGNIHLLYSMVIITFVTFLAYVLNTRRKTANLQQI